MNNPAMLAAVGYLYHVEAHPDSVAYAWPPKQFTPAELEEANRLSAVGDEWFALAREAGWDGASWPWDDRDAAE